MGQRAASAAILLKLLVQLWRVVCGALEVFTYFSILWNCNMILECWSTPCSYMVSKMWSHYGGEAGYFVVLTKVYCDHSLKNLQLFANLAEMTWKAQSVCLKNKKSRIDDSWSHICGKNVCVRVCTVYTYMNTTSV